MANRGSSIDNPRHILSISGGKDSAALAIHIKNTRNIPDLEYVFIDTGEELPETYEFLMKIEGLLGVTVTRIRPEKSFEFYLKENGNFLPSQRQRWCTINLKIKPFEKFIGEDFAVSYIGIRADEDRAGFISSKGNIVANYPFIEDGLTKADINRILEESGLGLPEYYKWRSRSGCYFCFYQQKVEWLGLKENHPDLYEKAKQFETVDEKSGKRFTWNGEGQLDDILSNPSQIRARHQKSLESKLKAGKNLSLKHVFAKDRNDQMVKADAFDQVMKEMEQGEGCLICTV